MLGIFEGIGHLGSSAINKAAQDEANRENKRQFNKQFEYQKERDELLDSRYEDETAYNRAFAEDERSYNRALQEKIFEREDTAIARQAQQLSDLGINPLSQNMNGLGAGEAVSSTSAPQAGNSQSSPMPSAPHLDAYTGFNLGIGSLDSVLEYMNQAENLHSAGVQRDLVRQEANMQKLQNLVYAKEHGISVDENGNPSGYVPAYTVQEQEEFDRSIKEIEKRDKEASAQRNERENAYQKATAGHDSEHPVAKLARDTTWQAIQAATNIKKAYDDHTGDVSDDDGKDSDKTSLLDRLKETRDSMLKYTMSTYSKFFGKKGKFGSGKSAVKGRGKWINEYIRDQYNKANDLAIDNYY